MSFAIQIGFWAGIFPQLKEREIPIDTTKIHEGVSVIICGRNEATNIKKYLSFILTQSYPQFEVIFVNDHSTDQSDQILTSLQRDHPHLKIIRPEGRQPGKKKAIRAGIKSASYNALVFTDADCKPNSNTWIQQMVHPLLEEKKISLGFGPFFTTSTFTNRFARYDGVLIFLLYGSLTRVGMPYMGVGRNMAYRKSVFSEDDFSKNEDLLSGDDDLLINAQATADNTAVVSNPASLVYSHSAKSFSSFLKQKRRHVSVAWRYHLKHKLILALFSGSHWFFYVGVLFCFWSYWWEMLLLLSFKTLYTHRGVKRLYKTAEYKDLTRWTFVLDLFYLIYYPVVSIMLYLPPPKKWK